MKHRRIKETSLSFFPLPIQKGSLKKLGIPCLSLWERWPSAARSERALPPWERWPSAARTERALPLPVGEVAERSEVGEGLASPYGRGGRALRGRRGHLARPSQSPAVTALPKGEPRGCTLTKRASGRASRGRRGHLARPSQSPTVTALPKGEPRDCTLCWHKKMERIDTDTLHFCFIKF